MNFIQRIFEDKVDDTVHLQFMKFSRGEFRDRAVVKVRHSKDTYNVATTAEFANELVRSVAEKVGDNVVKVTGAIVSTSDLADKIDFKEKKQFQGVKRYIIDKEMSGTTILSILDEFPKAFVALTFSDGKGTDLKIKPKMPKTGKPSSKEDEMPNPDFCRLKTTDKELGSSFCFEKPDCKTAVFTHTFMITDIIVPESLKQEKDFAKIREGSQRKGTILRQGEIDGVEVKSEKEFLA